MSQTLEQQVLAHFAEAFGLRGAAGVNLWQTGKLSLGKGMTALGRALDMGDTSATAHWAHSVKGDLLNMGLPRLADMARQIDEYAQDNSLGLCVQPFGTLRETLADCLEPGKPEGASPESGQMRSPGSD